MAQQVSLHDATVSHGSWRLLRKPLSSLLAVLLVVAGLTIILASSALARTGKTRAYALGDSFLAGFGLDDDAKACGSTPGGTASSKSAPNDLASKYTDAMTLTNLACAGATVDDLLDDPLVPDFSQIAAMTDDADLVILMVGGNDVDFGGIFRDCLYLPPVAPKCWDLYGYFESLLSSLELKLPQVYGAIRSQHDPVKIITILYPALVGDGTGGCLWLSDTERQFLLYAEARLNNVVYNAAVAAGAYPVDGLDAPGDEFWSHDICSTEEDTYYFPITWESGIKGTALHPNLAGRDEIVTHLKAAVLAHAPELMAPAGLSEPPPPPPAGYRVTADAGLNVRSGPSTTFPVVGSLAYGSTVPVYCQTLGQAVNGSEIWDAVPGGFVSDFYVSTPGIGVLSPGIPNCSVAGALPPPAPAPPVCTPRPQANAFAEGLSGDEGWLRSHPTITLSGLDLNGCGGVELEYALDGGSWTPYSTPFTINADGVHHVRHRARGGGVTSTEGDLEVKVDTVPPAIGPATITAPIDINNIIRDEATLNVQWTDAISGVRWVRHRCSNDPFTQTAGSSSTWTLAGAGVTLCDSYARDVAGWEAMPWNSGPLIFNRLTMDANGTFEIDSATGTTISGQTRAGNFRAVYNTGTQVQSPVWLTGSDPVVINGNTNSVFNTTPAPVPIPRVNYPFEFYRSRSVVVQGPLVIDNVTTPLPPYCLYVTGDITITAVNLNTKSCLIAEGSIFDHSTASTWISSDPANGVLLMAAQDIRISSTGNSNVGLVYAPDGTITFDGTTGLNSTGSAVAKNIVLDGVTNSQFSYTAGFASTTRNLPMTSPFVPAPELAPTPAVPAPGTPPNNATAVSTTPCLTWSGSAPAFEIQIATDATFDPATIVATGGSLETRWCEVNLPPTTNLFWRVRSLAPVAVHSDWGTVYSFTTKAPDPSLSVGDVTVAEGNSGTKTVQVPITRSGPTTGTSTVSVFTVNRTASAPADYAALAGSTVTFAAGETTRSVNLTINGDTTVEPDEWFDVRLSSPGGAVIDDDTGRVTLTNDDTAPAFSVNDVTLTEGDAGTQAAQFMVTRSGPTSGTSTVRYATRNGSAAAGTDYTGIGTTTLTFNPGETTKTVNVTVTGDTSVEADETFFLDLSSPTGATIADNTGQATIKNNDATFTINDVDIDEGDSGFTLATFTIRRTGATSGSASVTYATVNGSAVAPGDYESVASTVVVFAPGETVKTVSIKVKGDLVDESDETLRVVLSSPSGATISDNSGTVDIDDDD